jgi:hypothetical protein
MCLANISLIKYDSYHRYHEDDYLPGFLLNSSLKVIPHCPVKIDIFVKAYTSDADCNGLLK